MPPVLRERKVIRSTPGRGTRNGFRNFVACFKQENDWIQNGQLEELASETWANFNKQQRREFSYERYKIDMAHKLDMATIEQVSEGPFKLRNLDATDLEVLESPRSLDYSSCSNFTIQAEVHISSENASGQASVSNSNNARRDIVVSDTIEESELEGPSISEINEMCTSTVSVNSTPFANFLQDFSLVHGNSPKDNLEEATKKWAKMTLKKKEAYKPEKYVLKLLSQVDNCNDLNGIDQQTDAEELSDVEEPRKKTKRAKKVPKKPVKRLNKRAGGGLVPAANSPKKRGRPTTAPAVQISRPTVPARRSSSLWTFKNFIREFRHSNPHRLTVEGASLWRKMTPQERESYRVPKNNASRDSPIPEVSESTEDTEPVQQVSDGQLVPWTPVQSSQSGEKRNWLDFLKISKAVEKVKGFFG
ncbi:uncharacterized protein LOC108045862 [Drosophila rhopaloa]|uniref:HMG box domain-containing protein n=1 Tax=Drosophila rhopaloa TaxID=1041015 RepID=A0ABM5HIC5_DRORH|nr:uncharacterized protein LOC108045862 [Drosophila rhopaloa]XP_016980801.2 uncharacterized protein LOC108045862 [Drosophila rhopaloa]XP_016980802.2 uncharacterized protein LOC108045862 [Drosophila rhopaloa]